MPENVPGKLVGDQVKLAKALAINLAERSLDEAAVVRPKAPCQTASKPLKTVGSRWLSGTSRLEVRIVV